MSKKLSIALETAVAFVAVLALSLLTRLVAGHKMSGVSDKQVQDLGFDGTALHPATEPRQAGALYERTWAFRDLLASHIVMDDDQRFVTWLNQNAGRDNANETMGRLAQRSGT